MSHDLQSLVGTTLGDFRITALLGEGAMAVVFRGENDLDPSIARAIKVVRPERASDQEFVRRFAGEAGFLERLQHPNVVRFFGIRRANGYLFMELELLEGESLSARLDGARGTVLPVAAVVRWIIDACEGVAAAHAMGVVHRDLKPDNLFLLRDQRVKVLDFGIARAADEADRASRVTREGVVPGTPRYLAPEVAQGAAPSPTADVYALGVTTLELLLGYHPFEPPGGPTMNAAQLMLAHIQKAMPQLRAQRADVPDALERVLQRATAKNPAERFPTAADFGAALKSLVALLPKEASVTAPAAGHTHFALREMPSAGRTTGAVSVEGSDRATRERRRFPVGLVLAGGASLALLIALAAVLRGGGEQTGAPPSRTVDVPGSAPTASVAPVVVLNRWVRVEPARGVVLLGLAADNPPNDVSGFWPSRKIAAPINPYEIQEHEVTWEELAPWVQASADAGIVLPELPSNNKKPAAGVTWKLAHEYCQSLGAHLPTEEEWEWAARGPERRPNTWGTSPVDPERTWFYKGATGQPVEVMSRDQDQTPAGVFDLEGNVQEWMADLYRDDEPPKNGVESRSRVGGTIFRTIRGLPLRQSMPATFPKEATAYRDALCASGQCAASVTEILKGVGFRCARRPTR